MTPNPEILAIAKALKYPLKGLFYLYFYVTYWIKTILRPRTVFIHPPRILKRHYFCWKLFRLLGLRVVKSENGASVSWFHVDATFNDATEEHATFINGRCSDISKRRVEECFSEAFGYSSRVDPETHSGPLVQKSDKNFAHDGKVLDGPVTALPGYVYQIVVDNECGDNQVLDYRVCVVGSEIPFVLKKYRSKDLRFSGKILLAQVVWDANEVLSGQEIDQIIKLCGKIGLDVGEIDVLRDKRSGRAYVVDVNNTPHAPPDILVGLTGILCMHRAAKVFERQFLKKGGVPLIPRV